MGEVMDWFRSEIANKNRREGKAILLPISLQDLLSEKLPTPKWIAEELIPFGITALSGVAGRGKTWLVHEIAIKVARGEPLFGQFATTQTAVLIIDKENVRSILQERFNLLGASPDLPIYFLSMDDTMIDEVHIAAIITLCKMYSIGLVIFDALIRFHKADENDASQMSAVFEQLKKLQVNNISVIFNQHHRKQGGGRLDPADAIRGSSDILAAVDCHLSVDKDGDSIVVRQHKLRIAKQLEEDIQLLLDSSQPGRVTIRYVGGTKRRGRHEEKVKSAIVKLLKHEPSNQKEILSKLQALDVKVGKRSLGTYLQRMAAERTIVCKQGPGNSSIYSLPNDPLEDD